MGKVIMFATHSSGRLSSSRAPVPPAACLVDADELLATAVKLRDHWVVVTEQLETIRQQLVTS